MMNQGMNRNHVLSTSDFRSNVNVNGQDEEEMRSRSKSYVNLADALGEGLAESMGDSLEEKWKVYRVFRVSMVNYVLHIVSTSAGFIYIVSQTSHMILQ